MTFLSPLFFWAFLSLIPLVAVYLLKVRPRRKPTTAFFLWEQIFQEKRSTRLLRKLRGLWSLLLMMLAFCAVVLAMTNPQRTDDERKDLLILIDNSASMNADDGGRTRLDRAKEAAAEIVRAFNGNQRAAIATVNRELVYHSHLTDSPRQLLDAIEAIGPSNHRFQPAALSSSSSDQPWSDEHRTILISDGCFDGESLAKRIELMKVGESAGNAGIVAADLRYVPGANKPLGLYFQLASTFDEPVEVDLLINRLDGDQESLVKLIPVDIQPGLNDPQVYTLENAEAGRWTARLDFDDALDSDNEVYLAVNPPRPIRVAVESNDRFFLENSVLAFSRGGGLLTLTDKTPQIVVAKATAPDAPLSLIFQPQGDAPWWTNLAEEHDVVAPRVLIEDHPALRFVDAASIPFFGARQLDPPQGAQVLVASDDGIPLIYRATVDGKTAMIVNMDPVAAEFYFSAWFPVLVHSVATHLAGREESLLASYRPGDEANVPGVQAGEPTQVTSPAGRRAEVNERTLPLNHLGFYELNNKSGQWLVSCSLLSTDETLLDNDEVSDSSDPISRGWSIAQWLIVAAIVVLTAESLLYHRRKVG